MKNSAKLAITLCAMAASVTAFSVGANAAMSKKDMMMMKPMMCIMSHGSTEQCTTYPKAKMMMMKGHMKMQPMMCMMSHGDQQYCVPTSKYKMMMNKAM